MNDRVKIKFKDLTALLRLAVILCLILLPAVSPASDDDYGYPISDTYEATILGTPANLRSPPPDRIWLKQLILDIIPGLKKPDVFFYDEGLRCTLAYQNKKAPLVFLIAGTGAGDRSPKIVAMMKALYKAGYHVITLPSPTYPNFIISASQSHVPGDITEDAADLYRVMENAWSKVKEDIEVSEFYLSGYSLGGTHAAFVAKLDEERKGFNFRKVLMVNPAVNIYNSVTKIEGLLDKIPGGPRKIGAYFNTMLARLTEFYRRGDFIDINDEFLYAVFAYPLFSHNESGALIGLSFRNSLAGLIFSSDVMTNSGYVVPKNRVLTSSDPLGDYLVVSVHLSFVDYFDEYFFPYVKKKQPGLTREALIDSMGLKSIEGYLKSSPKFGVMTNDDDFILAPGELDYLRGLFGERVKIYPRGGHLGNLEYRDNMENFVGFFKQ
ncbi:MAG: alpha/beta fold hydrolase [Syntrophales bacterium]|nr:alpha/beta fold hydrolase [Syntrophales bacterium]